MRRALLWGAVWLLLALPASGQEILEDTGWTDPGGFGFLPYGYPAGDGEIRFATALSLGHYPQPHTTLATNLFAGTQGSLGLNAGVFGVQTPGLPRLFWDAFVDLEEITDLESFRQGNPLFPDERAGSNDSSPENRFEDVGRRQRYELTARYLLPLGDGRDVIIPTYQLTDGLLLDLPADWKPWNPWNEGRSEIGLTGTWERERLDNPWADGSETSAFLELELRHEHLDLPLNPSHGSAQVAHLRWDPGSGSRDEYLTMSLELAKYFYFGEGPWFRKRTLVVDFWTSYTPTWEVIDGTRPELVERRPPSFTGSTLGGPTRLRGYATGRFSDKAAIYYAAEIRLVPRWNPFAMIPGVRDAFYIPWWEVAPFVELGQVAAHWSPASLHGDMRWSAGVGIRFMVGRILIRLDLATSDESDIRVQAAIGQAFHRRVR